MPTPQKIKLFYDPLGNVIRTVNPDNTEQWVIHGKPHTLDSVEVKNHWSFSGYDPTPWESYTYDANDLATKTGHTATGHEFTPASAYIDPLGRPVKSIARLGTAPTDEVITQQRYDIQGNVLYVEDALNRIVFRHKYGIGKQLLWKEHIDSGVSTLVADATGKPITAIDARGAQVLTTYDALSRPIKVWAKEDPLDAYTLRQVSKYAENELGITAAKNKNIVGQLYQHFDEAGLNQIEKCDYKGNPLEKVKQVISDATLLASGTTSYTVDWTNSPSILDSTEYRTTIAYDALNRGTKLTLPKDINNHRAVIEPVFNTAGALERIKKDNVEYVKHIAYNAKGQQLLVAWNNDIMMRFAYDEQTFRLKRVKAERYTIDNVNPHQYNYNSGNTRYDQSYVHDLVGNILEVKDRTPDCGISGSTAVLDRLFEYDAIYRLIYANGREMNTQGEGFLFADAPEIGNATASNCRYYEQDYDYDKVGNIQKLRHRVIGNTSLNYTRNFIYNTSNNQHTQINNNQTTPTVYSTFTYDAVGNMLTSNADRFYTWDTFGRLKNFELKAGGTTSRYAHYLYDAGGARVKKIVINDQAKYESVTYIDGVLELHTRNTSGTLEQKNYLHLMGGIEQRIGSYGDDISDALIYHITDHLGSAAIRLDGSGAIIDKEEYYPYGDSSLRTFTKRRFRYIGKERDEESGLYQMGARYYAPWTCKFLSVDPLAVKLAHQSSYCYADCNPIMLKDPSGMQTQSNGGADKNDVQKTNELHLLKIDGEALKKSKSAQPMDGQVAPENNSALKTKQQQEVNTNIKMQPQVSKKTELKAAAATASVKPLQEIKQGLPPVKKEDSLLGITLNKMETSLTTVKDKLINTVEKVDDFGVKLGGYGGKLVESTIKPPVDKLDDYMKSASQVGANVEAKVDFNKYSVGGKLGFYSTSETNGGFEASANYTIKANIKKTKEEGWSSTLTTFKFKPSVKINFYVSRGEANKDSALWDVSNSTIVEGKAFAGPLEISTDSKKVDQFSIGLLKSKQDFGAEFGVKNQTKWFGYSGTFQIGH